MCPQIELSLSDRGYSLISLNLANILAGIVIGESSLLCKGETNTYKENNIKNIHISNLLNMFDYI